MYKLIEDIYNAPLLKKISRIIPVVLLALLFLWKQTVTFETWKIEFFEILSYSLVILGYFIRFWANGYRKSFKNKLKYGSDVAFVTCGPYAHVRHPLYLGNIIITLGVLISSFSISIFIIGGIITILIFQIIARLEEEKLAESIGAQYRAYIKKLPRFIPSIKPITPTVKLPFYLQQGLRDIFKMVLILLYFAICDTIVDQYYFRQVFIEPFINSAHSIKPVINQTSPEGSVYFALIGDTRDNTEKVDKIAIQLAKLKRQNQLDAIFTLGDNLSGRKSSDIVMKKLFEEPLKPVLSLHVPVYGCLGNSDRFHRKYEITSPLLNMNGCNYYKITFGDNLVTFFVLDSEKLTSFMGDQQQLSWLNDSLSFCNSRWKLVLMHRPIVSSKIRYGTRALYNVMSPILRKRANIVFAGHNHIYERFNLIDGVYYITVGGSGALDKHNIPMIKNCAFLYNKTQFFFWFEIKDDVLTFKTIDVDGNVIDSGSYLNNH
jgi:protein-S-isoprenylcysteine O-methyltransferase Ste14/predicted phosphodiesterase